jgi:hypothetical protein
MSGRKKEKARKVKVELPDLTAVFEAFFDAYMVVRVSCRLMEEGDADDHGPAVLTLHQGVDALDMVSDQMDEAELQLGRFRRKNNLAEEGAS